MEEKVEKTIQSAQKLISNVEEESGVLDNAASALSKMVLWDLSGLPKHIFLKARKKIVDALDEAQLAKIDYDEEEKQKELLRQKTSTPIQNICSRFRTISSSSTTPSVSASPVPFFEPRTQIPPAGTFAIENQKSKILRVQIVKQPEKKSNAESDILSTAIQNLFE